MSVLSNKDTTIYLAQEKLAEWAGIIATSSVRTSKVYQNKGETLRYYLHAIQYEQFLEESEIISILNCINNLAELQEWPTVPLLAEKAQPSLLLGIPGIDGSDGASGPAGTDADIDVVSDPAYDNMSVIEFDNSGVKTFKIGYAPYTAPTISIQVNGGSLVIEFGVVISSVPVVTTLNKGRDLVISSSITAPSGLDANYQTDFNLTNLNNGNQEIVSVDDTSVSNSYTYTTQVVDGNGTYPISKTLTFVIPFLYGSSATALVQGDAYANLSKLVQVKGDKTVTFNNTDSYFYFIYPASYGDLNAILDGNGFNATGAFTKTTPTIDMLSGAESMIMYRTIITDIPNQDYKFNF